MKTSSDLKPQTTQWKHHQTWNLKTQSKHRQTSKHTVKTSSDLKPQNTRWKHCQTANLETHSQNIVRPQTSKHTAKHRQTSNLKTHSKNIVRPQTSSVFWSFRSDDVFTVCYLGLRSDLVFTVCFEVYSGGRLRTKLYDKRWFQFSPCELSFHM
jgi:hypothetical protein